MELTEAAQRIIRRHLAVIVVLFLVGLALPFALNATKEDSYVATSRLIIEAADTSNADESNALADTALGIVTSPGQVEAALEEAKVARDADKVANSQVKIQSIGTSGVLELSVSDRDPEAAAAIANALAAGLVRLRLDVETGGPEQLLAEVDKNLTAVTTEIRELEAASGNSEDPSLQLRHDEAVGRRDSLLSQRQRLIEDLAATPQPTVIDEADAPTEPASSGLLAQVAVGGILGLLLGLAAAAVLEALRPTIVGPDALARHLGGPVLGRLPTAPEHASTLGDRWLPYYVSLAANGAGVKIARLVSVGPPVDLPRLAGWLRGGVDPFLDVEVVDPHPPAQRLARRMRDDEVADPYLDVEVVESNLPRPKVASSAGIDRQNGNGLAYDDDRSWTGIVVVAPNVLRRTELVVLEHQLAITQRPLLGIVSYKRRRRFGRKTKPMYDAGPLQPTQRPAPRPPVPASGGGWSQARNPSRRSPTPPS